MDNNEDLGNRVPSKKLHRLPRSVSEEVLALEGRFNPTPNDEENLKSRRPKVPRNRGMYNEQVEIAISLEYIGILKGILSWF